MDDGGDGAQDVCGEMGFAEEQARQKAPEPSQKQAAVVADGAEDGVDGVAVWTLEVVSFEQTIDFHVAEHGLDAVSSAHLAADCGRDDATGVGDHDLQVLARDAVAAIATVDVGATDRGGRVSRATWSDLGREAVAVIGVSRQGPGAEHGDWPPGPRALVTATEVFTPNS